MEVALVLGALLLGLAGAPHCTAMCAAPCAAVTAGRAGPSQLAFHVGRLLAYAAAGALAAASMGTLARLGQWTPLLRPLWTLLHLAALGFGLWLLWQGRQPAWVASWGRVRPAGAGGWQAMQGPAGRPRGRAWTPALVGLAWVAWPCGLLQSALVTAALARTGWCGAAAMAAFAAASSLGLVAAPWLWALGGGAAARGAASRQAGVVRLAGAALAAASAWALGHDLWVRVIAWCAG